MNEVFMIYKVHLITIKQLCINLYYLNFKFYVIILNILLYNYL